jgi:hypothetical protein
MSQKNLYLSESAYRTFWGGFFVSGAGMEHLLFGEIKKQLSLNLNCLKFKVSGWWDRTTDQ